MKSISKIVAFLALAAQLHAVPVKFLAWDEKVATRKLSLVAGDKLQSIESLHPLQRTAALNATPNEAGEVMVRATDRPGADGKPAEVAVKVASGMNKALVLLLPDDKSPAGVRGFAIEDSESGFPWGSYRVLNATGKPLAIALGKEKKLLPAGWTPVDLKPGGNVGLPVAIVAQADPKTAMYSAVWKPEEDIRKLVILVPSTDVRLGPLALKIIPEDRRVADKSGTAQR